MLSWYYSMITGSLMLIAVISLFIADTQHARLKVEREILVELKKMSPRVLKVQHLIFRPIVKL
jgi:hypothetical protein